MRDAGGVRGVQCRRDLTDDRDRPFRRHGTAAAEHGAQVGSVDQPHVDVEVAVDLAVIMDRHDVRLLQPTRGSGFTLQPFPENRVM